MRTEVRPIEYANKALEILQKGAFLTTAVGDKINTMTIGWGNIGIVWQKPVYGYGASLSLYL